MDSAEGITDEKFRGNIDAIVNQTDDCIFYSQLLAEELVKAGKKFRRRNAMVLRFWLPKLGRADWLEAEKSGLIPSAKLYESWLEGFKEKQSFVRRSVSWMREKWPREDRRTPRALG